MRGIYICGGIPPKIMPRILEGGLLKAFLRQGSRFGPVRASMPLHVVLAPDVGLLGARSVAERSLAR